MFQLNFHDPAVQAAMIGAAGSILTAAIAAVCAGLVGRQIAGRRRLAEKLLTAQKDIEFLLAVEQQHCQMHTTRDGQSQKNTIRKRVKDQGLLWSGHSTPGRVRHPEFAQYHGGSELRLVGRKP